MIKHLTLTLALCALGVNAAERVVSWEPPTKRLSGEAMAPGDIASYNLYLDGVYLTAVGGAEVSAVIKVGSGSHCVEMVTVDTDGLYSQLSKESCFTVKSQPMPPSGISVN